jgi:DNA-binding transcriptional LysR family regulator
VVAAPGLRVPAHEATWLLTGLGSGTRAATLELLTRLQLTPATLTVGTTGAAVASARAGLGVTLVHEVAAAADLAEGRLVALPVPRTPLDRPWHLITGPEPTAAARSFVRHVCDPDLAGPHAFHTRSRPQG